jgi:hypothetical protein
MRPPQFSEFSFGYALTENLMNGGLLPGVRGAPVFPSLYDEGKLEGGYDVEIPKRGAPLFLQFKIPQVVTQKSKYFPPGFPLPYYRMHIMSSRYSLQHQSLLSHESRGRLVYYATPLFRTTADLNKHYDKKQVPAKSVFIRPSQIGALDDEDHHVAYANGVRVGWRYSQPVQMQGPIDSQRFFDEVKHSIPSVELKQSEQQLFVDLGKEIVDSIEEATLKVELQARDRPRRRRDRYSPTWQEGFSLSPEQVAQHVKNLAMLRFEQLLSRTTPAEAVGYMARFYLDCELLIVEAQKEPR